MKNNPPTNREITMSIATAEKISQALGLETSPIAMTFVDEPPAQMLRLEEASPSACSFWRRAEQGVFYATAEQHFNCPIGAMVMGFALPQALQEELGGLLTKMCDCGYVDPEEADKIPTVSLRGAGVVYGPLGVSPLPPDFVVMWLTPRQAMLYNEAAGSASWTSAPSGITGRPACTAVAVAERGNPSLSLGCTGMRTFTDIADDRLLAVTPGDSVDQLANSLEETAESNRAMGDFYIRRKAEIDGSQRSAHVMPA